MRHQVGACLTTENSISDVFILMSNLAIPLSYVFAAYQTREGGFHVALGGNENMQSISRAASSIFQVIYRQMNASHMYDAGVISILLRFGKVS